MHKILVKISRNLIKILKSSLVLDAFADQCMVPNCPFISYLASGCQSSVVPGPDEALSFFVSDQGDPAFVKGLVDFPVKLSMKMI